MAAFWVSACCLIPLWRAGPLAAQEEPPLDWDFDTLFDESPEDSGDSSAFPGGQGGNDGSREESGGQGGSAGGPVASRPAPEDAGGGNLLADLIRRSGFSLDFSYSANAGFSPGWSEAPWYAEAYPSEYTHVLGVNLNAYIDLDIRVSDTFRTHSTVTFLVPDNDAAKDADMTLKDFYIDYNVVNRVFFRVGKYEHNWGISPNFAAANLLSRVPMGNTGGDSYIFKIDIPIGIGGFQFLALTRPGFMHGQLTPGFEDLGYGTKYNLAFTWADLDMGLFYHKEMPLRGAASIKTTIRDTELYLETMGAIRHETWDGFSISVNLGFVQSFLDDLISINGELFWNGEENAYYFQPGTELADPQTSPFIPGLNLAWNLIYRPKWIWDLRFAIGGRWEHDTNSAYILPGLTFAPLPHIDVSLGFPIALGSREGRYYRAGNADKNYRPFGIALLINLNGKFHLERH
jgi:hypothetical protein